MKNLRCAGVHFRHRHVLVVDVYNHQVTEHRQFNESSGWGFLKSTRSEERHPFGGIAPVLGHRVELFTGDVQHGRVAELLFHELGEGGDGQRDDAAHVGAVGSEVEGHG